MHDEVDEIVAAWHRERPDLDVDPLHVLPGSDPVLEWLRGTGMRPVFGALSLDDGERFAAELGHELRIAYPRTEHGTLYPFRRIFVVARTAQR